MFCSIKFSNEKKFFKYHLWWMVLESSKVNTHTIIQDGLKLIEKSHLYIGFRGRNRTNKLYSKMIHSILLDILDPKPTKLITSIKSCLPVHSSEIAIIEEVNSCAEIYKNIKCFANNQSRESDQRRGLYRDSFCYSVDAILDNFRDGMLQLEIKHIKNPCLPLSYFAAEIQKFKTCLLFLEKLINETETQCLHGCTVLGLLHKYSFHVDPISMHSLKRLRKGIYSTFLHQLSNFVIFGRLVDEHAEFFISSNEKLQKADTMRDQVTTTSNVVTERVANGASSQWQFRVSYGMIPSNLTASFAEKVLFIGQTVFLLIEDQCRSAKIDSDWNENEEYRESMAIESLWKNNEHIFFNRIQMLCDCSEVDLEEVVNDIKLFVTNRLSQMWFNQADLIKHLYLFKEFYLLGRGELFLDLINQIRKITTCGNVTETTRDLNQCFQKALSSHKLDLENVHLHLHLDGNNDWKICDIIKLIRLNFYVKWPLHLFFSPTVLENYSILFSFLLEIRNAQNELHLTWRKHRDWKLAGHSILSQLRNKMLFFIDNLQYYLQYDVLETQFSHLMNSIQNSNFESTQRAHNVFLANVMSSAFLLRTNGENTVSIVLNSIFATIRSYCGLNHNNDSAISIEVKHLEYFDEQFLNQMLDLLKLLNNRKTGPNSEPLSQLLLRLDYNYWLSSCLNRK